MQIPKICYTTFNMSSYFRHNPLTVKILVQRPGFGSSLKGDTIRPFIVMAKLSAFSCQRLAIKKGTSSYYDGVPSISAKTTS